LGNLNPFFLNAQPKSFSSGYRLWQVVQDVWYFRENAGIAFPDGTTRSSSKLQMVAVNSDATRFVLTRFVVLT